MSHVGRVVILGADGFLGRHLINRLMCSGADVVAAVGPQGTSHVELDYGRAILEHGIEVRRCDVRSDAEVASVVRDAACVVHLAALTHVPDSRQRPREYLDTNVVGTWNVLEAVRQSDVQRFVYAGSDKAYGRPVALPVTETMASSANSPYDASKLAAEQLGIAYQRSFGIPFVGLRFTNVYGPWQDKRKVVARMVFDLLATGTAQVFVDTNGASASRDFLYVDDAVKALALAIDLGTCRDGLPINVGTGLATTIECVAAEIAGHVDGSIECVPSERARLEISAEYVDVSRARRILGWSSTVSLSDGLARTVDWARRIHDVKARSTATGPPGSPPPCRR